MSKVLAFEAPLSFAIAEGDTTPTPGAPGVTVWSTTLVKLVYWTGSMWTAVTPAGGGGPVATQEEGVTLTSAVATINFTGAGVVASQAGGVTTVNVPGGNSSNPTTVSATAPLTPSINDIWLKV